MEIDNPINLLNWFLGKWEGSIVEYGKEFEIKIVWKVYGFETHVLEIYKMEEDIEKLIETQYLFFDKTKEQLKCVIFNTEGYVESGNVEIHSHGKQLFLSIVFDYGYNLPPNLKIVREIFRDEEDSLVYMVKMGEKQLIFSEANYKKTR